MKIPGRARCYCFYNKYIHNAKTGKFNREQYRSYYSGKQFQNWYGVKESGWIDPGETVIDNDNYGGKSGIWIYFGETEDGEEFIAMAPELKSTPWV